MQAMKSARAVFFVTDNISAGSSPHKEFQMGKNGVDAALEVCHSVLPLLLYLLPPFSQGAYVGEWRSGV